ncbi:MAG: hypothetical protein QM757_21545 [Paludibaculum sp.]
MANPPGMRVAQLLAEADQVLAAADVKNLAEAARAAAKLGEIDKPLAAVPANGRAAAARPYPGRPAQAAQAAQARFDRSGLTGPSTTPPNSIPIPERRSS